MEALPKLRKINHVTNPTYGFSILEVMIAVVVVAALGMGIYRLQLAQLSASQQSIARQLMVQSASNIANLLYANLNYCASNNLSRSSGCNTTNSYPYAEVTYIEHTTSVGITNCNNQTCSDNEFADFALSRWKASFSNMTIPQSTIFGIVCRDSSLAAPTVIGPNCDGNGGLVVKMLWQSHLEEDESSQLTNYNYLVMKVPSR